MPIIRWKPLADIDRFLEDIAATKPLPITDLAADVYEKDGNLIIEMNLAGIDADDVDITIEDDYVRISGVREEKKEKKEGDYFLKEIRRGAFERIIDLPIKVDTDQAIADFKDGLLTITMPKLSKREGRKISVKKAEGKKQVKSKEKGARPAESKKERKTQKNDSKIAKS